MIILSKKARQSNVPPHEAHQSVGLEARREDIRKALISPWVF